MSEISKTKEKRLASLLEVSNIILKTGNASTFIKENKDFIDSVIPSDFIALFDQLVKDGNSIEDLKVASNKIINIFHKPIVNHKSLEPEADTFLDVMCQNNAVMSSILKDITHSFKTFNQDPHNAEYSAQLLANFEHLSTFINIYVIKENILFPIIEESWPDYRCLQIMWSFHDDIRRNIKYIIENLKSGNTESPSFKRAVGDVFFNMQTIKFRDEKILFPYILSTINADQLARLNAEGAKIGYPFVLAKNIQETSENITLNDDMADLKTGTLSIEQIVLIFNHLPVDITYVDENDKVRFFSSPKKRIFPRTNAIIGRDVSNCHPPESVHVVEQIVESFKSGEKDNADFWIKMRGQFILIQYFAMRDEHNNYRGVLEVTQEVSDIRALEGEKRLLDW